MEFVKITSFTLTTTTTVALNLLIGLLVIYVIQRAIEPNHDPREPPIIRSRIPILGHIGALLTKGNKHFTNLWSVPS